MEKYPVDFGLYFFLGPIGMLAAHSSGFQFAGRPEHLLGQFQPTFARHGAQNGKLFRSRLFIRKHDKTVRWKTYSSKLFAFAKASSNLLESFRACNT
jgi:hypothetical protein